MRLFIAWSPDKKSIQQISALQKELKQITDGSWVNNENLHMTFAFLGEVPMKKIEIVRRIVTGIQLDEKVYFDHLGFFPSKKGNTLWLGMSENAVIQDTAYSLRQQLQEENISFSNEAFIPHITLLRKSLYDHKDLMLKKEIHAYIRNLSVFASSIEKSKRVYKDITA